MEALLYNATEQLRDGRDITIRPARPDDGDRIREEFRRMSPRSLYLRYHCPKSQLTEYEIDQLTRIDASDHVALVAATIERNTEKLIGLGEYFVDSTWRSFERIAEVAFSVVDDHQGLGAGTALLRHLMQIARRSTITMFHAYVLQQNDAMLAVFRHCGFPLSLSPHGAMSHVCFPIVTMPADQLHPLHALRRRLGRKQITRAP